MERIYKIKALEFLIRGRVEIFAAIASFSLTILCFIKYLSSNTFPLFGYTFIFVFVWYFAIIIINTFALSKIFEIKNDGILNLELYSSKVYQLDFSQIDHFCYYKRPVNKYQFIPTLCVYLKTNNTRNRVDIFLCISVNDTSELLSLLYKSGFKVLMFDSLKNIEETEHYKE